MQLRGYDDTMNWVCGADLVGILLYLGMLKRFGSVGLGFLISSSLFGFEYVSEGFWVLGWGAASCYGTVGTG
jgi:hypothetical protein